MKTGVKNILVITYWSYKDALIQSYTLPYVKIMANKLPPGSAIFLVTLDNTPLVPDKELVNYNILQVSISYIPFGVKAVFMWLKQLFRLLRLIRKQKIEIIHAWCTPAGMIGYILSILTGKRLIIDSYEPHAEAMVENGAWQRNSFAHRLLFLFEKLQTRRATYLIAATEGMRHYALEKYKHTKTNFFVKPACVNLDQFSIKNVKSTTLLNELHLTNKIVGVYAGKFGGIYLDKEVFDFFKAAEEYWKGNFVALILTSQNPSEIERMAKASGLNYGQVICKFVPHAAIADYMGLADFALTPVKPVPSKRYCTPIKDGEYWALGLPIVITPNISDDSQIIRTKKIGSVIDEFNPDAYLKSVKEIDALIKSRTKQELYYEIRAVAERYRNFSIAENVYRIIYGNKVG